MIGIEYPKIGLVLENKKRKMILYDTNQIFAHDIKLFKKKKEENT